MEQWASASEALQALRAFGRVVVLRLIANQSLNLAMAVVVVPQRESRVLDMQTLEVVLVVGEEVA